MARRKSLIARVISQNRSDSARTAEHEPARDLENPTLEAVMARIDRLEAQLEGLQDAVYRESVRQDGRITAITSKSNPGGADEAAEEDDPRTPGVRDEE